MSTKQREKIKGLPKRVGRENWKARFSRYSNNKSREKNKAKRIVNDALRSSNPSKVALQQAKNSPGTISFVEKILLKKNLI